MGPEQHYANAAVYNRSSQHSGLI